MSPTDHAQAVTRCSSCTTAFAASDLTMTSAGDWICRFCNANRQATVASNIQNESRERRGLSKPMLVGCGLITLVLGAILWFLQWFGAGMSRAL